MLGLEIYALDSVLDEKAIVSDLLEEVWVILMLDTEVVLSWIKDSVTVLMVLVLVEVCEWMEVVDVVVVEGKTEIVPSATQ